MPPPAAAAGPSPLARLHTRSPKAALVLLALFGSAAAALVIAPAGVHDLVAADEVIYVVGARNLVERATLDTNFYLPYSILTQGHPHRDVHLPGYVLALAPLVAAGGPTFAAAAALNLLLLPALVLLVVHLGVELLGDRTAALTAGALTLMLPPFPGFLFVAFPEFLVATWMLLALAVSARARDVPTAVLAGIVFGLGPLFRETLLLSLPVHAVLVSRRWLLRGFLPAAMAATGLVLWVFGRGRAALPNRMFPGILFGALASDRPLFSLAEAMLATARRNLLALAQADPLGRAEDLLLALIAAVALLASVGALRSRERPRRLGLAIVASFGLLLAVMTLTYPFRASGRILSGARMAMAWMPLLLLLACTLLPRRGWARALALAATVSAFFAVDVVHLRQAREWKADNARRQARLADFLIARLDAYRPRRIVMRSNDGFVYGLRRFPVEVVWPLRSAEELSGLEARVPFDFVVVPLAEPMDYVLNAANARYELMDAGRGGRWRVWRRRY